MHFLLFADHMPPHVSDEVELCESYSEMAREFRRELTSLIARARKEWDDPTKNGTASGGGEGDGSGWKSKKNKKKDAKKDGHGTGNDWNDESGSWKGTNFQSNDRTDSYKYAQLPVDQGSTEDEKLADSFYTSWRLKKLREASAKVGDNVLEKFGEKRGNLKGHL